jgi:hypothetical protein
MIRRVVGAVNSRLTEKLFENWKNKIIKICEFCFGFVICKKLKKNIEL